MDIHNRHKLEKWPINAIYIGRGSPFGNPFPLQEHGGRDEAIRLYRADLLQVIDRVKSGRGDSRDQATVDAIAGLREDSHLICSCKPAPCHGDVLREIWLSLFRYARPLVFVFGSNLAGRHGKGAAKYALDVFSAQPGIGEGPTGSSYALPTKDAKLKTRRLDDIAISVHKFMEYAKNHPETDFRLTRIGCGLAGYKDHHIAPLFSTAPANVLLPEGWGVAFGQTRRLLIAGSRSFKQDHLVEQALVNALEACPAGDLAVISGQARGADQAGEHAAGRLGIPIIPFPANWQDMSDPWKRIKTNTQSQPYNANAGFNRNIHMGMAATGAVLFWDMRSPGTRHMAEFLRKLGKPVFAVDISRKDPTLPVFRSTH